MELSTQIDAFLAQVTQFAENKHEILLGECESGQHLTSTQEHILMLLAKESLTNARIATQLKISPAAVTKAIKKLQEQGLISSSRDDKDERVIFWQLTDKAQPIAREHAKHHAHTLQTYAKITENFTENEQATIAQFLSALTEEFQ